MTYPLVVQEGECPYHGGFDHIWVTWEALESYHKEACDVRSKYRSDKCYYRVIAPPEPDNPCDVEHMREIST